MYCTNVMIDWLIKVLRPTQGKTKATFGRLLWPPALKRNGPILELDR